MQCLTLRAELSTHTSYNSWLSDSVPKIHLLSKNTEYCFQIISKHRNNELTGHKGKCLLTGAG